MSGYSCLICFTLITLSIVSCKKKEESDPCDTSSPYELNATVDGSTWCANVSLFADKAIVMTVNGINKSGSTLTLELDDFSVGTFQIKNNRNHILYTDALANAFESTNDNPGTLTITTNDTINNILKGNFSFTGRSPVTGNKSITNGNINVFYTE